MNSIYMSMASADLFLALMVAVLCIVIEKTTDIFLLWFPIFVCVFTFVAFALLIILGGRYKYVDVGLLEKFSWRVSELVIPNFAGAGTRDEEITKVIIDDETLKEFLENLPAYKHLARLFSYSKIVIFP